MQTPRGEWPSSSKGRPTMPETPAETAKREQDAALDEITPSEWYSITPLAFEKRRKGTLTRNNVRCILGDDGKCCQKGSVNYHFNAKDDNVLIQHVKIGHNVWALQQVRTLRFIKAERQKMRERVQAEHLKQQERRKAEQQGQRERIRAERAERQRAREMRFGTSPYAGLEGGDLSNVFRDTSSYVPGNKRYSSQFSASHSSQVPHSVVHTPLQQHTGTSGNAFLQVRQTPAVASTSGSLQPTSQPQKLTTAEDVRKIADSLVQAVGPEKFAHLATKLQQAILSPAKSSERTQKFDAQSTASSPYASVRTQHPPKREISEVDNIIQESLKSVGVGGLGQASKIVARATPAHRNDTTILNITSSDRHDPAQQKPVRQNNILVQGRPNFVPPISGSREPQPAALQPGGHNVPLNMTTGRRVQSRPIHPNRRTRAMY